MKSNSIYQNKLICERIARFIFLQASPISGLIKIAGFSDLLLHSDGCGRCFRGST